MFLFNDSAHLFGEGFYPNGFGDVAVHVVIDTSFCKTRGRVGRARDDDDLR